MAPEIIREWDALEMTIKPYSKFLTHTSFKLAFSMVKSLLLRKIISRHKAPIFIAFTLLFVELSLSISLPFFLGRAINQLVERGLFQIYIFVLVYLMHLLFSTIRKWNDTRVYTKIYNNLALEIVKTERANHTDISKTIARVGLAREITDFLDRDSPFLL